MGDTRHRYTRAPATATGRRHTPPSDNRHILRALLAMAQSSQVYIGAGTGQKPSLNIRYTASETLHGLLKIQLTSDFAYAPRPIAGEIAHTTTASSPREARSERELWQRGQRGQRRGRQRRQREAAASPSTSPSAPPSGPGALLLLLRGEEVGEGEGVRHPRVPALGRQLQRALVTWGATVRGKHRAPETAPSKP